jgi:small-conductance mechanosensitive channel
MTWNEFLNYDLIPIDGYTMRVVNILLAAIVAFATVLILSIIRRTVMRPRLILNNIDSKRRHSIFLIIRYFVWVISFVIILECLGLQVKLLLAGSAALLVGIGFGLQPIFADLISGLFLLFEGTVKIGDVIEADGVVGKIHQINLRSTEVMTRDNMIIIIPNSKFVVEKVVNWSHNHDSVRFMVEVGVSYSSDVDLVMSCLKEEMDKINKIAKLPASFVRFTNFGESSLDFQLIFWTKETFVVESLKSDLRKNIHKRLQKEGITIPFPQRDLHIKSGNV